MRKYELNEKCFEDINNGSMYWVGFLYADGYIYNNRFQLCLSNRDRSVLNQFRNFIRSDRPIREFKSQKVYDMCEIRFRSWKAVEDVKKYQLHINKDSRGRLNPILLQEENFRYFLRGYFDGDGCFYMNRNHLYSEITGYLPVLKDIKNMLVILGITGESKKITKNGKTLYRIRLAHNDTLKLGRYLYEGEMKYFLKRKYEIYNSHVERLNDKNVK